MSEQRQTAQRPRARGEPSDGLARLQSALKNDGGALTPSARAVAAFFRDNLPLLPFETGASIAAKTGVSEMTVIRFIRSLGYSSLRQMKDELRSGGADERATVDDVLERFRIRHDDIGELKASLKLELKAVIEAYELTTRERWRAVVELLARRRFVHVVGFQATKGVALDFATRLKYARPGVRFVEGAAGVYSEVLDTKPEDTCLVLIDTVAYARKGVLLARRAREQNIPLITITDRFSNWAYEFTDLVLPGATNVHTFWDSTASLSVICNLLINSVAVRLGAKASDRFKLMNELGRHFREFEPLGAERE
jgi:DNA-binding MurR/RpiR family transcriptional regulator